MAVVLDPLWRRLCALGAASCLALGCSTSGYDVELRASQRDYPLASPRKSGAYRIRTHTSDTTAKSKLVFDTPFVPGEYAFELSDEGPADQTVVLSVPLSQGKYRFAVSAAGRARYDIAFHDSGPKKEYRYTLQAPLANRVFALDMPQD